MEPTRYNNTAALYNATEAQRLALLPSLLSGAAATWHQQLKAANSTPLHDWTAYKKSMIQRFEPYPTPLQAWYNLDNCRIRNDETIQQHRQRFMKCWLDLPSWDDTLLHSYIINMRPTTRGYLMARFAAELNDRDSKLSWLEAFNEAEFL